MEFLGSIEYVIDVEGLTALYIAIMIYQIGPLT